MRTPHSFADSSVRSRRLVARVADSQDENRAMLVALRTRAMGVVELVVDPSRARYLKVIRPGPAWLLGPTGLSPEDRRLRSTRDVPRVHRDVIPELLRPWRANAGLQLSPQVCVLTMHQNAVQRGFVWGSAGPSRRNVRCVRPWKRCVTHEGGLSVRRTMRSDRRAEWTFAVGPQAAAR